jgi:NAD(P)-dependent dehydrogenase (short-subunit alcohol dehydrogenase family)
MSAAFISGASRGIGLALVERLLARTSLSVVAASRSAAASPALLALEERYGASRLTRVPLDVTDEASIDAAARAVDGRPLELLVHVAAMMHPSGKGENTVRRLTQASTGAVFSQACHVGDVSFQVGGR